MFPLAQSKLVLENILDFAWVSRTIPFFMMIQGDFRRQGIQVGCLIPEQTGAMNRVVLDGPEFFGIQLAGFFQDEVRDGHFAQIVQHGGNSQ